MKIRETFRLFKKTKVFLIGDIMLDQYIFGNVNRISPEAPVPIFLKDKSKEMLGGSGNVLSNLISLGTNTFYLSIVGKDDNALKVRKLLNKLKPKNYYLLSEKKRKTTVKTRYIVNSQQIIRVDEEDSAFINKNLEDRLIKKIDSYIMGKDVAVISDYNKGIITERISKYVIKKSNALNIPVIIDPKNEDFNIYRNATLITPNQLEVSKVTKLKAKSDKDAEACGKTIIKNII